MFLTAEEVLRIEQSSGIGSATAPVDGDLSAGMQVSACAARALRDNARSNVPASDKSDLAEPLTQSIESLSLDATILPVPSLATLTLNDIEEHKGVKIRRRVKVAAKNNYFDPSVDNNVPKDGPVLAPSVAFADPLVALMNSELPSPPTPSSLSTLRAGANTMAISTPLPSLHLPPAPVPSPAVPTEPIRNPRRDRSKVGAGSKVNWIKDTVSGSKQGSVTYGTVGGLSSDSSSTTAVSSSAPVEHAVATNTETIVKTSANIPAEIADAVPAGAQRRERSRPGAGGRVNRTNSATVSPAAMAGSTINTNNVKPQASVEAAAVAAVAHVPSNNIPASSITPAQAVKEDKKIKEGKAIYNAKDARSRRQQAVDKNTSEVADTNSAALEATVQSNNMSEDHAETNHTTATLDSAIHSTATLVSNAIADVTAVVDTAADVNITNNPSRDSLENTTATSLITPPMIQPIEEVTEYMGCNSCLHPSCPHSATMNRICDCPGDDIYGQPCTGSLILDVNSKPNWKLACNKLHCNTLIRFRGEIHDITPQTHIPCPECGVTTANFEFNKLRSPLPNGATTCVGCVVCDEFLNSITEVVAGRAKNLRMVRQERYKRGGMMGGRGRGRGRGGRVRDVKMSFSDF